MPSSRETILADLHARLQTLAAPALRGEGLPERVPATGLIVLRDGKAGEPEVTLSPLTWFCEPRPAASPGYFSTERGTPAGHRQPQAKAQAGAGGVTRRVALKRRHGRA